MFATKKRHRINATRSSQSPSDSRILSRQKAHQTAIRNILYSNGGQAGLTKELPNGHFDEGADRVPGQGIAIPDPMRLNRIQRKEPVQTRSYADRGETHIQMQEEPRDEEEETLQAKSMSGQVPQVDSDIESKINNLKGTGRPLEPTTRAYFEPRFGQSFSQVRIHSDDASGDIAKSINARAFTHGNHVVMGSGEYQPSSSPGKRLLAHELTHVLQQNGGETPFSEDESHPNPREVNSVLPEYQPMNQPDKPVQREARYAPSQRTEMAAGRVTGGANDLGIASEQGFQPGDIVFRLGSSSLGAVISEPVTHGGIYIGNGLIHDMVGFGNRTVRVSEFYLEADDPSVIRVIRFSGPHASLILTRLIHNINSRDFRLPSDPKPWNLFSSATDYTTATCLEYSHAQFLYAINQLSTDTRVSSGNRSAIRSEYFASGATAPRDLISPHGITQAGDIGVAYNIRRGLIAAADYLAEDVDPSVFENRWEGTSTIRNVGSSLIPVMIQEETLQAFTYQSFVDSRRYFSVVSTPNITARTTPYSQRNVEVHGLSSDSDIRDWVGRQSATDLADLPGAEKVRLIRRLLQGWVTDDDVTAVEQLCTSVRTSAEMRVINGRIRPMTSSLNNFDQRARVRLALDRRP